MDIVPSSIGGSCRVPRKPHASVPMPVRNPPQSHSRTCCPIRDPMSEYPSDGSKCLAVQSVGMSSRGMSSRVISVILRASCLPRLARNHLSNENVQLLTSENGAAPYDHGLSQTSKINLILERNGRIWPVLVAAGVRKKRNKKGACHGHCALPRQPASPGAQGKRLSCAVSDE